MNLKKISVLLVLTAGTTFWSCRKKEDPAPTQSNISPVTSIKTQKEGYIYTVGIGGLALPTGIVLDAKGNIYVADEFNSRVYKIAPGSDYLATIAGNGKSSLNSSDKGDNGPATNAELVNPCGVAVDLKGNIYITSFYVLGAGIYDANEKSDPLRKIDVNSGYIFRVPTMNVTTGPLQCLSGVAVDAKGNIYIADANYSQITKIDSSGNVSIVAGGNGSGTSSYGEGDGGLATAANLYYPQGITIDTHGNIYIADTYNNRIRKVDASTGIITTVAGDGTGAGNDNDTCTTCYGGDGGLATVAKLNQPEGVAVDAQGNIYIADTYNHRIRKVDGATGIISTVAGNGTNFGPADGVSATTATVEWPHDVAVDGKGNIYIAEEYGTIGSVKKVIVQK